MKDIVRVQQAPFDPASEYAAFRGRAPVSGASVMFVGTVRDFSEDARISAMTLEHYPGMTEKAIAEIVREARGRWPLKGVLVIHRFGRLKAGEDIVLVITASDHRADAFAACEFLMDWLKTRAPFWKLEETPQGARWVEAKASDDAAAARWEEAE
jgi:molybdopterin synthase catalytic subunit